MTADAERWVAPPRWDPIVRLTHWGVALAIVVKGLINEGGSALHVWIGYGALALVLLRMLWGLIGPEEARFSAFPPSLGRAREHLDDLSRGRSRTYRSHNPLGSLMAYALWATLVTVTATGIAMAGSPFEAGNRAETRLIAPAFADDDEYETERHEEEGEEEGEEVLEEVHEIAANLLLVLAGVHVVGVAFESRLSGRNLTRAMVTGRSG